MIMRKSYVSCQKEDKETVNSINDIKSFNYLVGGGDNKLNDIFKLRY